MILRRSIAMAVFCGLALPAARAAEPARVAVFDFEIANSSLEKTSPEETARLARVTDDFRAALTGSGRYAVVDTGPATEELSHRSSIRNCNQCELPMAQRLGATYAAYGWVQKVSNLILNLNVVVEDVATGRVVHAGSADMRGNTDDSWERALRYLLRERVLTEGQP